MNVLSMNSSSVRMAVNVFVYGTLQSPELVQKLLGRVPEWKTAIVSDYCRYRIRGRSYPAAVPKPGSSITGKVFLGVSAEEVAVLDEFESDDYKSVNVQAEVKVAEHQVQPEYYQAVMYEWAAGLDQDLYGEWDYEGWREKHMSMFLQDEFD